MIGLSRTASRRDVMRGVAGIGLAAPLAIANPATALAQDKASSDYSGHPAVGVWFEGGPTFQYLVVHGDGTVLWNIPWVAGYLAQGDPKLTATGLGLWRPTGERSLDATWRATWGDASVDSLLTFWVRWAVTGNRIAGQYRATLVDRVGEKISADAGYISLTRFEWEPFEEPATPEATPGT